MELLYVWIEDYNNIYRQGFNFSPKHKFEFKPTEFDEKGNVTGGTLTHDDINTNYPDNFFGDHISNITAIVGKNGSGKSSLVNCIRNEDNCTLIVFEQYGNIRYWTNNSDIQISFGSLQIEKESVSINFFNRIVYYSPFINSNRNYLNQINRVGDISNIERLLNALRGVDLTATDKQGLATFAQNSNDLLSAFCTQEMTTQIDFVCKGSKSDLIDFNLPTKVQLAFPFYGSKNESFATMISGMPNDKDDLESFESVNTRFFLFSIFNAINKRINSGNIIECNFSFSSTEEDVLEYLNKLCEMQNYEYEEIIRFSKLLFKHQKVEPIYNKDKLVFEFNLGELIELGILSHKDNDTGFWIHKNWVLALNLNLSWRNLSDGEATLLSLFARLWETTKASRTPLIILFDEFELGLHPQWQKEAISKLVLFFNSLETKGHHLILTTHSPILLSDLPRENILFLGTEKDKEGKYWCKVCDPEDMDRTFGANIHNLYRSSFFMQDGLMGAFAKGKIDKVIKDLNGGFDTVEQERKETRKKELDYIIGQIGEPVIQGMLRKKYNDKFHSNGSLNERILKLEEELAYLKMKSNDSN